MTNSRYPENVQVLIAACELSVCLVHLYCYGNQRCRQECDSGYIQPSFCKCVCHCKCEYCDKYVSRFLKTVISSQTDGFCYICSVLINHLLLWKIVFMNSSDRSTTRLLVLYAVRILHSSLKENPLFHTVAVIMSVNS